MKKLILLIPALLIATPGCIYVRETRHVTHSRKKERNCHPSEYWDGDQCRHKGKGKGARKHDH